jgi:hypothetical protein
MTVMQEETLPGELVIKMNTTSRIRASDEDVTERSSLVMMHEEECRYSYTYPPGNNETLLWYMRAISVVGSPSLPIRLPSGAEGSYNNGVNLSRCKGSA